MFSTTRIGTEYLWKLALLVGLLLVDAVVACIADYDVGGASSSAGSLTCFAAALLNQFAVAATLYWILTQTYPFQVGLVGVVTSRFHKLFLVGLLYFLLTTFASGIRVMNHRTGMGADLLSQPFFLTMSSLSKLLAPFYYAMTVRAAFELCFPVYYDEEAWQILERPILQERTTRTSMKKEPNHGGGHRKNKYLRRGQEDDDNSSSSSGGGGE
jgi:hypothetical protein